MSVLRFIKTRWAGLFQRSRALDPVLSGPVDSSLVFRASLVDLLADRKAERRSKLARAVLYFLMFALPACLYVGFYAWSAGYRFGPATDVVGVVRLNGEMIDGSIGSADRVIPALRKAFESEHVRAIVLSIDSPGGSPLEAERIYSALESWRATHPKPVVAVINNLGASAAYMVALHADSIVAGNYSLVGSVGAILSGWDAHQALERLGVAQRVYASGELKSMMNPYMAMSPDAERKARDLVAQIGRAFRADFEKQRKGRLAAGIDFASGEVWAGADAKRIGLIDELATLDQVVKARWPELAIHDYGPSAPGLPFAGAASDWMEGVLTRTTAKVFASKQTLQLR